ncbi:ankyrin-3-like isoform X1 [Mytilus californianus]|uniref:ankyrin-3-like isoform X1 n=1 Tax=Mytilus californianus TaxID=6549 RepID=UPI002247BC2F|nr:ankyrin-3-like isoform X1 [Mytilus californianus]XP_052073019.1 ankyrin-3-like isoform X1 [Mytilus californianus]XP_052073020.1 ankyrin-3-like isoform X1 [Mytilus californianus]
MSDENVVTLDQKCTIAKQLLSMDDEADGSIIDNCRQINILRNIEFAPLTFTIVLDDCDENIPLFYADPIETYSKELNALNNVEDKSKLCALFFLIVHNGNIDENYYSVKETMHDRNQRESISEEFGIQQNTPRSSIEDHLMMFEGRLTVNERGIFRAKYHIYFDFLCFFFGENIKKMQKMFINYAHSQVISRKTVFDSLLQLDDVPRFTISITSKNEQIYFKRMVEDICDGIIWDTLENTQLHHDHTSLTFSLRFFKYLEILDDDKKRDIVNSLDRTGSCSTASTLYVTVYFGLVQIVKYLLRISSAQLQDSQDKFPPLIAACERGHEPIVNLLIDYEPDINQMDSFGRRPLIVAVQNDYPGVVEMLINKDANINLADKNGWTPFLWACILHREEVAKLLMEHDADDNQASNDGSTLLFWCSVIGFQKFVVLLHEKGAEGSLSTSNTDGKTPLMAACYFRRQEIVIYLLQHLESVDESDHEGWTPLMEACFDNDNGSWDRFLDQLEKGDCLWFPLLKTVTERVLYYNDSPGHESVIKQLLSKADIDLQDNEGKSALYHACEWQYNRIVNILTEMGANVNLEAKDKSTALMEACLLEDEDIVQPIMEAPIGPCRPIIEQLLSKGADVNSTDENGLNPFGYSCETGNSNMIHRLIEYTNNVNQTYKNGNTPLQMAEKSGNDEIISLLIQKGANQTGKTLKMESHDKGFETMSSDESISDSSDSENESLTDAKKVTGRSLLQACRNINEHMFPSLLQEAASENILNISGKKGKTPLLEACRYKNIAKVQNLLEAGASVNKEDINRWTPLLEACKVGEKEIVLLILENNVDVNKTDARGYSPLLFACKNGYKDIVEILLSHRADANIANNAGITRLLVTCTKQYTDIVQLLIYNGANINQTDAYGNTSLMVAGFYGYKQIIEVLLSEEANIDQKDSEGWTALSWATKGGYENIFVKAAYVSSVKESQTRNEHTEKPT